MKRLTILFSSVVLVLGVKAAFQDFVVNPETTYAHGGVGNELNTWGQLDGCESEQDYGDQVLVSFEEVVQDGEVNTELLMRAVMQQAKRLGLDLAQLAQMQHYDEDWSSDTAMGCYAGSNDQPSWRDIFFN